MPGETDVAAMLATLDVERRPGTYGYVDTRAGGAAPTGAVAMIAEGHTTCWVVPLPHPHAVFPAAWLTLTVDSSLEAVGLTAAFSAALAEVGIPTNVLAGLRHDHILVPADRADDAVATLRALACS